MDEIRLKKEEKKKKTYCITVILAIFLIVPSTLQKLFHMLLSKIGVKGMKYNQEISADESTDIVLF